MIITLSDLHVGMILKFKVKIRTINTEPWYFDVYIVLTDLMREIITDTGEFYSYTIIGRKLFGKNLGNKKNFNINQIKKEDIKSNQYYCEHDVEIIPEKNLSLLINEKNKTIWFEKVLNDEITNKGINYYNIMKKEMKPSGFELP